jgi:biopolymer transport protein ExbD
MRIRNLAKIRDERQRLELTPMIDVTFLILVFFLCTLRFQTLEGKLATHLPKDAGANVQIEQPDPPVTVRLAVTSEGTRIDLPGPGQRFTYGPDRRIALQVESRAFGDFAAARQRLTELARQDPERRVVIDAQPGIVYAEVVSALDAVLEAGFDRVAFAGAR